MVKSGALTLIPDGKYLVLLAKLHDGLQTMRVPAKMIDMNSVKSARADLFPSQLQCASRDECES